MYVCIKVEYNWIKIYRTRIYKYKRNEAHHHHQWTTRLIQCNSIYNIRWWIAQPPRRHRRKHTPCACSICLRKLCWRIVVVVVAAWSGMHLFIRDTDGGSGGAYANYIQIIKKKLKLFCNIFVDGKKTYGYTLREIITNWCRRWRARARALAQRQQQQLQLIEF